MWFGCILFICSLFRASFFKSRFYSVCFSTCDIEFKVEWCFEYSLPVWKGNTELVIFCLPFPYSSLSLSSWLARDSGLKWDPEEQCINLLSTQKCWSILRHCMGSSWLSKSPILDSEKCHLTGVRSRWPLNKTLTWEQKH